jgi:SAM-dependent methyltransferase
MVTDPGNIRENALCMWCKSISRNRHVARCIVEVFAGYSIRCLKDLAKVTSLRIYNMAMGDCFGAVWGRRPHIVCSEYWEGWKSGERREGVLCQDVRSLSFDDDSFDLVVSQDVFEHVPYYGRGFAEVFRVLKPEGYHIFSVPVDPVAPTTSRFALQDGRMVAELPVELHGDPMRGETPVVTTFGRDLLDYLREVGFEASLRTSEPDDEERWGVFGSYTFVTRKA